MFGSKIFAEVKAVGTMLGGLKQDFADFKATFAIGQRDLQDVKNILVEIRTLTGHAPAVPAVVVVPPTGTAPVPVVEVVVPAASGPTGLTADLAKDVAGVNPMQGVKLP
jgi:hypothetical protein